MLGHYKSERGEAGLSAKPVALRDHNSYSVILGRFRNEGYGETVTLAQVFWFKEPHGQPARFYVVADRALSIQEHFSGFGRDINSLRKRLRKLPHVELFDSFPPYGAAFRRRFGIEQRAGARPVPPDRVHEGGGRPHRLRAHATCWSRSRWRTASRHMIAHFDDLTRAHEAVLKARAQIERLTPIVADCDAPRRGDGAGGGPARQPRRAARVLRRTQDRAARQAHRRPQHGDRPARRAHRSPQGHAAGPGRASATALKQAILENGGDRIAALGREIDAKAATRAERQQRAESYGHIAGRLGLPEPRDADAFLANRDAIAGEIGTAGAREADIQNKEVEAGIEFRTLNAQARELTDEIASLKSRRSNIPARMLAIRDAPVRGAQARCRRPAVRRRADRGAPGGADWEGAAERLLHGFAPVAAGARRALRGRGRLGRRHAPRRPPGLLPGAEPRPAACAPGATRGQWPTSSPSRTTRRSTTGCSAQLGERYDHICCASLDEFRREEKAVTRTGQIKAGRQRHEKDDRTRIDDRANYVLGWSNAAKIAALEKDAAALQARIQTLGAEIAASRQRAQRRCATGSACCSSSRPAPASTISTGAPSPLEIERLEAERRQLEEGSDKLKTLKAQLDRLEQAIAEAQKRLEDTTDERSALDERPRRGRAAEGRRRRRSCRPRRGPARAVFPQARRAMRPEALGEHRLTVESCDGHEREMRDWLQARIDAETHKLDAPAREDHRRR